MYFIFKKNKKTFITIFDRINININKLIIRKINKKIKNMNENIDTLQVCGKYGLSMICGVFFY